MASQPVAISVARDVEGGSAEKDGAKVAAKAESDASAAFHFHLVSKSPLKTLQSKENAAAWVKWGLEGNTRAVKLRYEENFEDGKQTGAFLRDLVNSRAFHDAVTLKNAHKSWNPPGRVTAVDFARCPCTLTSMELFARLSERSIALGSGEIRKCLEEVVDGVVVADELRRALLCEESENFLLFDENERAELLFKLLATVALGGSSQCQYEDTAAPYLELARCLYKDLVTVRRDSGSGQLVITSEVFEVHGTDGPERTSSVFASHHRLNRFFVCVNPALRHATVFYLAFNAW